MRSTRRVSVGRERCVFVVHALLRQRQLQRLWMRSQRIHATYADCNSLRRLIQSPCGITRQNIRGRRCAALAVNRKRILATDADCSSHRESTQSPCGTTRRTQPEGPYATRVFCRSILATCADCNRPKKTFRSPCGTTRRRPPSEPCARNAVNRSVATQIAIANVTLCIGCSIRKPWRNETTGIA